MSEGESKTMPQEVQEAPQLEDAKKTKRAAANKRYYDKIRCEITKAKSKKTQEEEPGPSRSKSKLKNPPPDDTVGSQSDLR